MGIKAKFYDRDYFENGVASGKSGYAGYNREESYKTLAADLKKHFDPKIALDLGCAKGFLVEALVDLGVDTFGIDISDYAVKHAPKNIGSRIYKGSCTNLWMFKNTMFDLIIAYDLLEHLDGEELDLTLGELSRVGSKWLTIKCPFEKYDWDLDKSHIGIRPKEEWIEIMSQFGFSNYELPIPKSPWTFWDDRTLVFLKGCDSYE
jgi:SAM-dependent methyltransferase